MIVEKLLIKTEKIKKNSTRRVKGKRPTKKLNLSKEDKKNISINSPRRSRRGSRRGSKRESNRQSKFGDSSPAKRSEIFFDDAQITEESSKFDFSSMKILEMKEEPGTIQKIDDTLKLAIEVRKKIHNSPIFQLNANKVEEDKEK